MLKKKENRIDFRIAINAKQEFLNHIGQINTNLTGIKSRKVLCASIQKGDDYDDDEEIIDRTFILTTGYNQEDC
jgi:hypothetical protein